MRFSGNTNCLLPCLPAQVLVSGGTAETDGGTIPPVAEVWDAADPSAPTQHLQQPQSFVEAAGKNWFPSLQLLPRGACVLTHMRSAGGMHGWVHEQNA